MLGDCREVAYEESLSSVPEYASSKRLLHALSNQWQHE